MPVTNGANAASHRWIPVAVAVLLTVGACASGRAAPTPPTAAGGDITATLAEWRIDLSSALAPAGRVSFSITNRGAVPHEFLIIRTDTSAGDLPVMDNMIDIAAMGGPMSTTMNMPGMSPSTGMAHPAGTVGVVDELAAGATALLAVDVVPGHYVVVCDLPAHYQQGMRVDFTVQ